MVTAFVVLQACINVALLVLLARLLRERVHGAREAREREGRLEALATELCAVGREIARQELPCRCLGSPPAHAAGSPVEDGRANRPHAPAEPTDPRQGLGARIRGATALLDRGMPLEAVVAETSLLPGEVQLLSNLRRRPTSAPRAAPGREAAQSLRMRDHQEARRAPTPDDTAGRPLASRRVVARGTR